MIPHKAPPFQNVGANQTAVMPFVHAGMSVVGIVMKLGGGAFTIANVSAIRLRFDGKQFVDLTGTHLDKICKYENLGSSASYLYLPFGDLNAMTQRGQMLGAIDTSIQGLRPLEMEVDIGAATTPTLDAWLILAPPKAKDDPNKATIRAILKSTHPFTGAGEYPQMVPTGSRGGSLIHRVYFMHANMTKLQVTKDGLFLLQEGEEALLDYIYGLKNRSAQTGLMVFDPTFTDNQMDAIATLRPLEQGGGPASFEWKLTVSGADSVVSYTSLYTTIDKV